MLYLDLAKKRTQGRKTLGVIGRTTNIVDKNMVPKFLRTVFTFFILIQDARAQPTQTKIFFYNLPIDKSKTETINFIKSDSSLFRVDKRQDPTDKYYSFDAEIKKSLDLIPSPSEKPRISVYDIKVFIDDSLKLKIPTIALILVYDKRFGSYRKAKKAYNIIVNKSKVDYKDSLVRDNRMKEGTPPNYKEKEAKYFFETYAGKPRDPDFTIELIETNDSNAWTVILTYTMQKS